MSKKKGFSGSTMSLNYLHGGSIPSDIPLPSGPGSWFNIERSNSDHHISTTWRNTIGWSDHRPRPKSSGPALNFDDNALFLSHPGNIGRNFDEDERTPLDGGSGACRTITTDSIHMVPHVLQELKSVRSSDRQATYTVSRSPSFISSSSLTRYTGMSPAGSNCQFPGGGTNSHPNAWGVRKEVMGSGESGALPSFSKSDVVSKFAEASALEKASSVTWQSKSPIQLLPHLLYSRNIVKSTGLDMHGEGGDYDATLGRSTERGWNSEDRGQGGEESLNTTRVNSSLCTEDIEVDIRKSLSEPMACPELSERPKLKLLPRTISLDKLEKYYKQGCLQASDSGNLETVGDLYDVGTIKTQKQGFSTGESRNEASEHPKLNLKPLSQLLEQLEGNNVRDRSTLFGGTRPRETGSEGTRG